MKRLARVALALALAAGLVVGVPLSALANDDPTVDYEEFDRARLGHTPTQIQGLFDSPGILASSTPRFGMITKKYRKAVGDKATHVIVFYQKQNGVYRLTSKSAWWTGTPDRSDNTVSKSEYLAIKAGMKLSQVRVITGALGTPGRWFVDFDTATRTYLFPAQGSSDGWVEITFSAKDGTYLVSSKYAAWNQPAG